MAAKKSGAGGRWMSEAFSNAHGQFTAKAKAAGMSTMEYAEKVTGPKSTASTKTKRQAQLVKNARRGK
jgi:hypothetical protein